MNIDRRHAVIVWVAVQSFILNGRAQGVDIEGNEAFRHSHTVMEPHNAESCVACHASPVVGGSSRVAVKLTGIRSSGRFIEDPSSGALNRENRQDNIGRAKEVEGLRITLNLLGDGYVEAVPEEVFKKIAHEEVKQTGGIIHGQVSKVSVVERPNAPRTMGRFGWKAQNASLLSASAHALGHELRVPNYLFASTTNKAVVPTPAIGSAPEAKEELASIVRFLRSTDPILPDAERGSSDAAQAGSRTFDAIGCSICHVRTLKTAAENASVIGGTVVVKKSLADREIHTLSDYLLHNIGTGDGIVQNVRPQDYDDTTREKFRTAPLWGLRYRTWLMHDGKSVTYHQAIIRHSGEANQVIQRYLHLSPVDRENLRLFLDSL